MQVSVVVPWPWVLAGSGNGGVSGDSVALGPFRVMECRCQWWFHGLGSLQGQGMGVSVMVPWPWVLPGSRNGGVSGGSVALGPFRVMEWGCQWWFLGSFQDQGMQVSVVIPWPWVLPGSRNGGVSGGSVALGPSRVREWFRGLGSLQGQGMVPWPRVLAGSGNGGVAIPKHGSVSALRGGFLFLSAPFWLQRSGGRRGKEPGPRVTPGIGKASAQLGNKQGWERALAQVCSRCGAAGLEPGQNPVPLSIFPPKSQPLSSFPFPESSPSLNFPSQNPVPLNFPSQNPVPLSVSFPRIQSLSRFPSQNPAPQF
ncbi:uncharacterized protein LOC134565614 [Prinia subflava]|uniref:uncharacterized protein LOC134565614 n=1 Tax=Prinia subflava TaxID=208062 RepID=UPI002FE2A4DA